MGALAPAPAYGEAIALVHAVFDALGRLPEPDVRTHLGEPLAALIAALTERRLPAGGDRDALAAELSELEAELVR